MKPGALATVYVDAFPGYTWWGHVESFSPASGAKYALIPPEPAAGNFTKVVQRIPVKIVLDQVSNGDGRHPVSDPAISPQLAVGLSARLTMHARLGRRRTVVDVGGGLSPRRSADPDRRLGDARRDARDHRHEHRQRLDPLDDGKSRGDDRRDRLGDHVLHRRER